MLLAGYVCRLCPHSLSLWLRPRGPHRRPAMDRTWATIWTMVSARTCAWATSSQKHDCANKEQWLLNPINPCWLIIGYRDLLGVLYIYIYVCVIQFIGDCHDQMGIPINQPVATGITSHHIWGSPDMEVFKSNWYVPACIYLCVFNIVINIYIYICVCLCVCVY